MRLRVGFFAPIGVVIAIISTLFAGKMALQVYKMFFMGLYKLLYWTVWLFVVFTWWLFKGMYLWSKMITGVFVALYISFKEKKEVENE